jgi:hypothetical protein
MEDRIDQTIADVDPGDEIVLRYRLFDDGELAGRVVELKGRVRWNTIYSPRDEGLLAGVEKLVVESSNRSDHVKAEVWSDGGLSVRHNRDATEGDGRLLGWRREPGELREVAYP